MERNFFEAPSVYVGEVSIKVTNLDRSVDFYESIIGLKVLEKSAGKAVLTADGKTALLTLEQPTDVIAKTGRTSGLYHFAILLPSRADFSVFLRHLLETRYRFGASDHFVSEALYIQDPDDNGIEVYTDRPASKWTWNDKQVEMATVQLDGQSVLAESDAPWNGMPAGTIMGHIHLHVGSVDKAEKFYQEGLGFKTVSYYPQAAFMSTGGYHHHIAINTWQGVGAPAPASNVAGLSWYSLVFPDVAAREEIVAKLKSIGAVVAKEGDWYTTSDPSGNVIRLVV